MPSYVDRTQYGLPYYTIGFNADTGSSTKSTVTPDISTVISLSPDPTIPPIKRRRPKQADLVWSPTALEKWRATSRYSPLVYRLYSRNYVWVYRSSAARLPVFKPSSFPYPSADPMNKAINKLRAEVTNFAQSLGEYKQTSSMFEDAAKRFIKSLRHVKKGNPSKALDSLGLTARAKSLAQKRLPAWKWTGTAANAWLLYHFGVECLVRDVDSMAKELKARQDQIMQYKPIVSASAKNKLVKEDMIYSSSSSLGSVKVFVTYRTARTVKITAEVSSEHLKSASDHGLTNIVSLGWELTSLSWAIDYFIGIGEWIQAWDYPSFVSRTVCTEVFRGTASDSRVEVSGNANIGGGDPTVVLLSPVHAWYTARHYNRVVRTVGIVRPQWNPSLSTPRIASLVALLRQKVSKK